MQSTKILVLLLFWATLLLNTGCEDDDDNCVDVTNPECPNYDYCVAVGDITANIEAYIERSLRPFEDGKFYPVELIIEDTTFAGSLNFRAVDEPADNYEWIFGEDPRSRFGKETRVVFDPSEVSGNMDITLTVDRELAKCPEKGFETKTKTESIYLIGLDPDFDTQPILGKFIGNNESEKDLEDFTITFFNDDEIGGIRLKGFPRGAVNRERLDNPFITDNYKTFLLVPTPNICCSRAHGNGVLSDDKQSLRIDYQVYDFDTEEWTEHVWKGKRVVE